MVIAARARLRLAGDSWLAVLRASLATAIRVTSAETEITAELVRDLLRDQHPDLGDHTEGFACGLTATVDLGLIPDPDGVSAIWDHAVTVPGRGRPAGVAARGPPHSANVLTADCTLCGVIDFGSWQLRRLVSDHACTVTFNLLQLYAAGVSSADGLVRPSHGWRSPPGREKRGDR